MSFDMVNFPFCLILRPFSVLAAHDPVAEGHDGSLVSRAAMIQDGFVKRIVDKCHCHADNADDNAGDHSAAGHADDEPDVRHDKAHAAAHNDSVSAAEDIGKYAGRTPDLRVKLFQCIELRMLLFHILRADLLCEIFLIIAVHNRELLFVLFDCSINVGCSGDV